MTRHTRYCLKFPDGLHLDAGTYGFENTEVSVHSDTLFSALCCAALLLDGEAGIRLLREKAHISSMFPFAGGRFFFPKPMTPTVFEFRHYANEKKFRKLKYLGEAHLKAFIDGRPDLIAFNEKMLRDGCWFDEAPEDQDLRVYKLSERPRIVTDRTSQAAEIYHFSEVHFGEEGGLFFLADFGGDTVFKQQFETYLRVLGDEGIGADSAVGKGLFEIKSIEEIEIPSPGNANAWLLLSLYNPSEAETPILMPQESYYEIITRRGWASAPGIANWRRRSLRMFSEGSVLVLKNNEKPHGAIPAVLNAGEKLEGGAPLQHDVWRYGRAYCLPIKI